MKQTVFGWVALGLVVGVPLGLWLKPAPSAEPWAAVYQRRLILTQESRQALQRRAPDWRTAYGHAANLLALWELERAAERDGRPVPPAVDPVELEGALEGVDRLANTPERRDRLQNLYDRLNFIPNVQPAEPVR